MALKAEDPDATVANARTAIETARDATHAAFRGGIAVAAPKSGGIVAPTSQLAQSM